MAFTSLWLALAYYVALRLSNCSEVLQWRGLCTLHEQSVEELQDMLDVFLMPSKPGCPTDTTQQCLLSLQWGVHGKVAWAQLIAAGEALQALFEGIVPSGEAVLFLDQALTRIAVMTSMDETEGSANTCS